MANSLKYLLEEKNKYEKERKYIIKDEKNIEKILDGNLNGGIINNKDITSNKDINIIDKIKNFFKSDFFHFIKNYLFFLILFSICFYILLYINNNSTEKIILVESKIFFYLLLLFLFIIINDILETPQEYLNKFLLIIIISLILVYITNYMVEYYYKGETFNNNLKLVLLGSLLIFIINIIIIYFTFQRKNNVISSYLYNSFNKSIKKNYIFLIFITLYLYLFKTIFYYFNWNSNLTNILCPTLLGAFLLVFIFCIIIFISYKMKIINNKQFLNSFLALTALTIFFGFIQGYIFINSLNTICSENNPETPQQLAIEERLMNLMLISIFIILWYDDSRNWHQLGSILFIIVSFVAIICMFYYANIYPSISLVSFWLFIEWLIIIFRRKENSKNSLHFSFMKT